MKTNNPKKIKIVAINKSAVQEFKNNTPAFLYDKNVKL